MWSSEITWKHWNKITKEENDENVPHVKITKVVLVYCNIANNEKNPKPLKTKNEINITVVINWCATYKKWRFI